MITFKTGLYVNISENNNLNLEEGSFKIEKVKGIAGGYGHGPHDYYPSYTRIFLENGEKFSNACYITDHLQEKFYTVTEQPLNEKSDTDGMPTFNASTNWLNGDIEHEQKGRGHFAGVLETLEFYQEHGTDLDGYEHEGKTRRDLLEEGFDREEVRAIEQVLETFEEVGSFWEYGLSFDFVEADEDSDGYYRFQICWGGPSSEIRFYPNDAIEAVYMDWFVGVGFNVNTWDAFIWLRNWFEECELIDFDSKIGLEYVYSEDYRIDHGFDEEDDE